MYCLYLLYTITNLFTCFAKSSFALLEIADGFTKLFFPKIGPESITEIQFRISTLPQQIVAQS